MRSVAALLLLLACSGPPPGAESQSDDAGPPTECSASAEEFDAGSLDYAEAHGLPTAWVAFEASERKRLCLARGLAAWHRARGGVRLSVSSCRADVPDAEGEERAAAIGDLLRIAYPGLGFDLAWRGDGLPLQLDCPNAWGRVTGARVVRDSGAVHEVGHLLGLPHHYASDDEQAEGRHMWSEGERCTMDLTGGLDAACAGALGVELPDRDALAAATWRIYCAGCARGEIAASACSECLLKVPPGDWVFGVVGER